MLMLVSEIKQQHSNNCVNNRAVKQTTYYHYVRGSCHCHCHCNCICRLHKILTHILAVTINLLIANLST